ncbi:MAG: hypothetical protein M3308_00355, partial [Actinomycetota bacterium]|nr:hypothetical protein [Actinomycetota bacterium]
TSPLLCAMLCALNLDRRQQLPPDRMALYRDALALLLERRDAEREVPAGRTLVLDTGSKLAVLQHMAWRLSLAGRAELPRDEVLALVRRAVERMPNVEYSAEDVLQHLLDRSGVLREPVVGRVDFVHRTFQEHLAAKEAVEDQPVDVLVTRAHLDQWWETIVMAVGHATPERRAVLLGGVLDRADTEPRHCRRLRLLAAACLDTAQMIRQRCRWRAWWRRPALGRGLGRRRFGGGGWHRWRERLVKSGQAYRDHQDDDSGREAHLRRTAHRVNRYAAQPAQHAETGAQRGTQGSASAREQGLRGAVRYAQLDGDLAHIVAGGGQLERPDLARRERIGGHRCHPGCCRALAYIVLGVLSCLLSVESSQHPGPGAGLLGPSPVPVHAQPPGDHDQPGQKLVRGDLGVLGGAEHRLLRDVFRVPSATPSRDLLQQLPVRPDL